MTATVEVPDTPMPLVTVLCSGLAREDLKTTLNNRTRTWHTVPSPVYQVFVGNGGQKIVPYLLCPILFPRSSAARAARGNIATLVQEKIQFKKFRLLFLGIKAKFILMKFQTDLKEAREMVVLLVVTVATSLIDPFKNSC